MSAEDRRRVSAEMMARIDAVVSGHELQRSAESAPQYVGRVEDRPLRFEGPCDLCQMCGLGLPRTVPCTWCGDRRGPRGVVHHLDGNPQNNAVENLAFVDPSENGIRGAELDFVIFDELSDGPEATTAFFEGVDRARRRFAPGGIVASGGLISADTPYLVSETGSSCSAAPETRTASQDASEGTLRGWLDRIVDAWGSASVDARLRLIALLDRDDR